MHTFQYREPDTKSGSYPFPEWAEDQPILTGLKNLDISRGTYRQRRNNTQSYCGPSAVMVTTPPLPPLPLSLPLPFPSPTSSSRWNDGSAAHSPSRLYILFLVMISLTSSFRNFSWPRHTTMLPTFFASKPWDKMFIKFFSWSGLSRIVFPIHG